MCHKLIKEVEQTLRAVVGKEWVIENGGSHRKIRIRGEFVCVFSVASGKDVENVKKAIRRFAKGK